MLKTTASNDPTLAADALLGEIAREFSQRLAAGENPSIEEYTRRFPQLADAIREVFPALSLPRQSRATDEAAASSGQPQSLGDFRILRQIGRGGMGVVYEAEQESLKRRVALKVLPFASMLDEEQLTRFKNEAYAAASLDHDHIVHAYAVGCDRGVHYFAMQYIEGQNLAEVVAQLRQMQRETSPKSKSTVATSDVPAADTEAESRPPVEAPFRCHAPVEDGPTDGAPTDGAAASDSEKRRQVGLSTAPVALGSTARGPLGREYFNTVAALMAQAAEALDYAHQRGVVHRDVKPSNLLLDAHRRVYVTDFGLAFTEGNRNLTITGDIVGTLRYMSPEQASGDRRRVDHRTDIYSLGATLYEFAVLIPAFAGDDHVDLLRRISNDEPPPARIHNRRLPADLETIIDKAMSREPDERYATAAEFAADLRRFAADDPIHAVRPSLARRALRWARRRTGALLAALSTAVVVVAALSVGTGVSIWQAREADSARRLANDRSREAQQQRQVAEERRRFADEQRTLAERATAWSQTLLYASDMKLASDAIANNDLPRADELLERHRGEADGNDRRGFEWHFFHQRVNPPHSVTLAQGAHAEDVELSPDGNWLATTAALGTVRIYSTATWERQRSFLTFTESANALAWSPDSRLLAAACADGSVRIWDLPGGALQTRLAAHEGEANDVAFSPDGRHLYSCGDDNLAIKWLVATGESLLDFTGHLRPVERIAVSHDGHLLASAGSDEVYALWDPDTALRLHWMEHREGRIVCVAFSPDDRLVAAGNINGRVYLADTNSGASRELARQLDGVEALAFFAGGEWLATADRGGAIQLHRVPESLDQPTGGVTPKSPRWVAHDGRALSLTATKDWRSLISGGRDSVVRVWTPNLLATRWSLPHNSDYNDIAAGADGRLYVAGRGIEVWDLAERRLVDSFADADPPWMYVERSADGRSLTAARSGQLVLFDLASGEIAKQWQLDTQIDLHRLAISPDGRSVALAEYTERAFVDLYAASSTAPRRLVAIQCEALAFSRDGRSLAAGNLDDAFVYGLQAGDQPRHHLRGHSSTLSGVAFSPDGQLLATVSHDRMLKIWRTSDGEEVFSIVAHHDRVRSVAFAPDGRTIATAGEDGLVKLWHTATGQPLGALISERSGIEKLRFSDDGRRLIALLDDCSIVVYDAAPFEAHPSP